MDSSFLTEIGFWISLPFVGFAGLVPCLGKRLAQRLWSRPVAGLALVCSMGISIYSLPLLWLAETGRWSPLWLGFVGWIVSLLVAASGLVVWLRSGRPTPRLGGPAGWTREALLVGLAVISGWLAWNYPANTLAGGRDEGVYALTGAFLAEHGLLEVPYPWRATYEYVSGFVDYPGFYHQFTHLEPQFSHLLPVWLALARSAGGLDALLRLNGLFALLSGLCFYLLVRTFVGEIVALGATAVLLLNVGQVWISRVTLSEAMAQLMIVSCLVCLVWALAADSRGLARWAGVLAGLGVLVRIDGLLLMPFLVFGLVAAGLVARERRGEVWAACVETLVPVAAVAIVFYSVFSPTYLRALRPQVTLIVVVGMFALYLAAVLGARASDGPGRFRRFLQHRGSGLAAGAAVILLAGWAYWVRPPVEAWHGDTTVATDMDLVPDTSQANGRVWSLVNLGRYLTPGLLGFAVVGFAMAVRRSMKSAGARLLWPCLLVLGGFSVLYLYDPLVRPAHFWAVRRFVPAIIPGFIFFAALALHRLERRASTLSSRAGPAIVGLALLAVLGTMWERGKHYFLTEESAGFVDQLTSASQQLPERELVILPIRQPGWHAWASPLNLAFDHRIVPINPASRSGAEGLHRWWSYQHERGRPIWILTPPGMPWPSDWPAARQVADLQFERRLFEQTYHPIPQELETIRQRIGLYRSDPPGAEP